MIEGWHRAGSIPFSTLKLLVLPNPGRAQNHGSHSQEKSCNQIYCDNSRAMVTLPLGTFWCALEID